MFDVAKTFYLQFIPEPRKLIVLPLRPSSTMPFRAVAAQLIPAGHRPHYDPFRGPLSASIID
jgi:hypothetical protein